MRTAVEVTVVDARTGQPPLVSATLIATSAGRADTNVTLTGLPPSWPVVLFAGLGRPGVYWLVVRASGYEEWQGGPVTAHADRCGQPRTARVTARLQVLP